MFEYFDAMYGGALEHSSTGKERSGHKYQSRYWKNGKWNYVYSTLNGAQKGTGKNNKLEGIKYKGNTPDAKERRDTKRQLAMDKEYQLLSQRDPEMYNRLTSKDDDFEKEIEFWDKKRGGGIADITSEKGVEKYELTGNEVARFLKNSKRFH